MELMSQGGNSLIGIMGNIFPLLSFASKATVFGSLIDFLIVLLGNAIAIALFLFIGQKLYFSGVIGMNETSSKRKKISLREQQKMVKGRSVLSAYMGKEWKMLVRTPVYFLNCALMPLIWPVFFLIPIGISLFSNGIGLEELGSLTEFLPEMMETLKEPSAVGIVLLVIFGLTAFIGSMGFVSGTAISREGQGFVFMKYIPVPYRTQLLAKLSVGVILSMISTTGYALVVLIIMTAFGFPVLAALLALLMSLCINGMVNLIDLGMDLVFPKLNWENEQMAVKQNMNTMLEMLLCIVVLGALGVLYGISIFLFRLNVYLVSAVFVFILAAVTAGLYALVMGYGEKKLSALE